MEEINYTDDSYWSRIQNLPVFADLGAFFAYKNTHLDK